MLFQTTSQLNSVLILKHHCIKKAPVRGLVSYLNVKYYASWSRSGSGL